MCQEKGVEDLDIKKRHPSGEKVLFPPDECIICGKGLKWYRLKGINKRDRLIKCVTMSAEETLKQSAITRKDEDMMRKISGLKQLSFNCFQTDCQKNKILTVSCSLFG